MLVIDALVVAFVALWAIVTVFSSFAKVIGMFKDSDTPWLAPFRSSTRKMAAWNRKLQRYDHRFKLLPAWYFFSGSLWYDPQIYVRGLRSDFSFTEWENITPEGRDGTVRLSYPTKYEWRLVRSMLLGISPKPRMVVEAGDAGNLTDPTVDQADGEGDDSRHDIKAVTHRINYQVVLQYLRQYSFDADVQQVQFLVATDDDVDEEWTIKTPVHFKVPGSSVLFVSPFHSTTLQTADAPAAAAPTKKRAEQRPVSKQPVVA